MTSSEQRARTPCRIGAASASVGPARPDQEHCLDEPRFVPPLLSTVVLLALIKGGSLRLCIPNWDLRYLIVVIASCTGGMVSDVVKARLQCRIR